MRGTKGKSGRKKGIPNKVTAVVRTMLMQYIEGEMNWINDNLETLDTNQRLTLFTKILPFVIPRTDEPEPEPERAQPPTIIFTKELK